MIAPKQCKRCKKVTKNFQKADNAWCLDCREQMKSKGTLYCSGCGKAVWETYTPQQLCGQCAFAAKVGKANIEKQEQIDALLIKSVENAVKAQKQKQAMQKGEVKKLPAVNSPLWTDQWAVQGSGNAPYIVSHKKDGEWQCSCPAWTRNTPREDCKHILKVKLVEKVPSSIVVGMTKTVVTVESGVKGVLALNTFDKKGRKFR